ncbi:MAG: acetoin dehydrogenase [Chloroflexota bacterium]
MWVEGAAVLVDAVMTRTVVTVAPTVTLAEAAALMHRGRFRHLPVLDGGRLVGVVSEREVRPPPGLDPTARQELQTRHVREVMTSRVITVAPDDPLEHAALLLYENKIGCLPVLRGQALVGIITASDIFQAFVRMTGLLEPATRVEISVDDLPAILRGVADVVEQERMPVVGLLLERGETNAARTLVVRFATLQGPRLTGALRARGLPVHAPQSTEE